MKKIFFSLLTIIVLQSSSPKKELSPNIILIFMDDMGYGDLSCYGAVNYRTPNIDKMASEGIRFTNFLAAQAVCSASRAALLTGCYPNRIGISGALMPNSKNGINSSEIILVHKLEEATGQNGVFERTSS